MRSVLTSDGFGGYYPVEIYHNSHLGKTLDEAFAMVNEIYTLFDEGLISEEEAELALGLTNDKCVNQGVDLCEDPECPFHGTKAMPFRWRPEPEPRTAPEMMMAIRKRAIERITYSLTDKEGLHVAERMARDAVRNILLKSGPHGTHVSYLLAETHRLSDAPIPKQLDCIDTESAWIVEQYYLTQPTNEVNND